MADQEGRTSLGLECPFSPGLGLEGRRVRGVLVQNVFFVDVVVPPQTSAK